jgi:hypothetical protein
MLGGADSILFKGRSAALLNLSDECKSGISQVAAWQEISISP